MASMNAHPLFLGANASSSYHQAIQLPDSAKRQLKEADDKLRRAIRAATRILVDSGGLRQLTTEAYKQVIREAPRFDVRFLLQGGLAYNTAVSPVYMPPQQADRDTGVYVQTTFLDRANPSIAAKALFRFVENAIRPVVDSEGWEIKEKNTCVRVQISPTMHIDYPMYAIPDDAFVTLQESFRDSTGLGLDQLSGRILKLLDQDRTLRLPADRVMLAHRNGQWKASDPRALHDWFLGKVDRHGPQLQRMSRYLKGWRDYEFQKGGPSSISLMVCAANCFTENFISADEGRDDQAFNQLTGQLSSLFRGRILNPVLDVPTDLNDWDDDESRAYVNAAHRLNDNVSSALTGHYNQELTVSRLQQALGARIPNRPDLVKLANAAAVVTPTLHKPPAPLESIRRTTSG